MCQLTFADLGNLNKTYITTQLIINALDNNPDGTGVFTKDKVWKTELNAGLTTNLGDCLKNIVDNNPVVGHVRLASNKTLKDLEHSHPFKGKFVTQVHNGRLAPKDDKLLPKDAVDSLFFMNYLEELWGDNLKMNFPAVLLKAMEEWQGKFALMYYVMKEKTYYIAKGRTANLFWTTVNNKLVVNTERKSLVLALNILNQQYQLTHAKPLEIGEIKSLDNESLFRFDPKSSTLEKLEDIKEETIITKQSSNWGTANTRMEDAYAKFIDLIFTNGLSFQHADYLCHIIMGCSLVEMDYPQLSSFNEDVLEIIKAMISIEKEEAWNKIRLAGLRDVAYANGLTFPWMYATADSIRETAIQLGVA